MKFVFYYCIKIGHNDLLHRINPSTTRLDFIYYTNRIYYGLVHSQRPINFTQSLIQLNCNITDVGF